MCLRKFKFQAGVCMRVCVFVNVRVCLPVRRSIGEGGWPFLLSIVNISSLFAQSPPFLISRVELWRIVFPHWSPSSFVFFQPFLGLSVFYFVMLKKIFEEFSLNSRIFLFFNNQRAIRLTPFSVSLVNSVMNEISSL